MKLLNYRYCLIASAFLLLAGCSSSNDQNADTTTTTTDSQDTDDESTTVPPIAQRFEVQLTNLTNGQSFSEALLVMHPASEKLWEIGQAASNELEELAESGSNDGMSNLAIGNSFTVAAGDSLLSPGGTQTLTISNTDAANTSLTIMTRMKHTNDGFTGVNAIDLSALNTFGQSISFDRWALDAGTQKNLESVNLGSLDPVRPSSPNDIGGSEFNHVSVHPGVLTEISPLSDNTSQLNQLRKFDNPVIRIRITRVDS